MNLDRPWHEADDFWAELLPVLTDDVMWTEATKEAGNAALRLGVRPGKHILDLGCGAGRHSIALARAGFTVTGVDRTKLYLEAAARRAAEERAEVEWVQQSMLEFRREESFDGTISLFTSFGYFASREDDLTVLRNVHASLRPGARFVLETIGKEVLARVFTPRHWQETSGGRFWLQDREAAPGWERLQNRWLFVGGGRETKEYVFEHRLFSGTELAGMFEQAGFREVSILGGLDGRPYDREAMRLVVLGAR